mmetsp:Transcript_34024/g.105049  ORF Transcript_34024/g.105049 Transcript_34024/m.105049 type:complete len:281 (-) Transcript_34024:184-1026(-)
MSVSSGPWSVARGAPSCWAMPRPRPRRRPRRCCSGQSIRAALRPRRFCRRQTFAARRRGRAGGTTRRRMAAATRCLRRLTMCETPQLGRHTSRPTRGKRPSRLMPAAGRSLSCACGGARWDRHSRSMATSLRELALLWTTHAVPPRHRSRPRRETAAGRASAAAAGSHPSACRRRCRSRPGRRRPPCCCVQTRHRCRRPRRRLARSPHRWRLRRCRPPRRPPGRQLAAARLAVAVLRWTRLAGAAVVVAIALGRWPAAPCAGGICGFRWSEPRPGASAVR